MFGYLVCGCAGTSGSLADVSSDLRHCQCACVPKETAHMSPVSGIGTENHVGQRIKRLLGSPNIRGKKIIPSIPAALGILISSHLRPFLISLFPFPLLFPFSEL